MDQAQLIDVVTKELIRRLGLTMDGPREKPLLVAGEGRASNGSLMPRVGGVGSLLRRMP